MENPQVFIYLVLIILYFIFNYFINSVLGKKKPEDQQQDTSDSPDNYDYDPWDPFGDLEKEEGRSENRDRQEQSYENSKEDDPFTVSKEDQYTRPEERPDLGEPVSFPEEKSTLPDTSRPLPESRESTEYPYREDAKRFKLPESKPGISQREKQASTIQQVALSPAKKRRRKIEFDARKAVIYDAILNRPKY